MTGVFLALLLLFPAFASAQITSIGTLGTGTSVASNTTLTITTGATIEAGNLGVLIIAVDNECTSPATSTEISSVTDSAGNTYMKRREYCWGSGAANDAATVSVWTTIAGTQLASGGTVTITLANTKTSKAATFWEFGLGVGSTVSVSGNAADTGSDSGNYGSQALSGLSSREYLFVRAIGAEGRTQTFTPTANHTGFTPAAADEGNFAGSMIAAGEFRILTGTGDTSDPATTDSVSHATIFVALQESAAAPRRPIAPIIFQ